MPLESPRFLTRWDAPDHPGVPCTAAAVSARMLASAYLFPAAPNRVDFVHARVVLRAAGAFSSPSPLPGSGSGSRTTALALGSRLLPLPPQPPRAGCANPPGPSARSREEAETGPATPVGTRDGTAVPRGR